MSQKPIVILGGGGHAKVLLSMARELNRAVLGFCDPKPAGSMLAGENLKYIGTEEQLETMNPQSVILVNGLGSTKDTQLRTSIFKKFRKLGFAFETIIHPTAIVAKDCSIGEGTQIMAGTVIQTGTKIGHNCIINTSSCIDHDCRISDHVHVASGATLCGHVMVGEGAHIGTGATIIQCINVGSYSLIAAGAVVIKDVREWTTVMGLPATHKPADSKSQVRS